MRQQVCFAMAMVSGAKLMLLDEPMNALDPSNALSASRLLREQCSGGATVLLSTHLLQGLDSLADQVLFLDRGRIAYVRDKDDARPTAEVYADLYLDAMNVGDA
jgi:ABC-2 type transport system ATP-binding protein